MSNEKKVWVSIPSDYRYVNIYSIGMNIPNFYDYQALQANRIKLFDDIKNQELRKRNKELSSYGSEVEKNILGFKKFPTLPDSLWLESDKESLPTHSDYIFQIQGGGVVLNEACAKILMQFNLGESTLTPLKIHKLFTDELWLEETFYFFNFCEKKTHVVVPQKNDHFEFHSKAMIPYYSRRALVLEDNMLEVNKNVTECDVDIWHDPAFSSSCFLSDSLYQALYKKNMCKKWNAHFCKLV